MAERFNLTAQLQLQAPRNVSQVVGSIQKQLSGVTANVQVKGDTRTLAKINKQMQGLNKASDASSKSVNRLNRNLSEAARRFSVITVATGTMLALARAIKNSVGEAIAFEREMIKIAQVTGKTVAQLEGLSREVTNLATTWGVASSEILGVSRVLAQAGFDANKTKQALDILAKTSLGATFESITDTTEGAIAVLRQFSAEAKAAGGDIKFLEQTMDAINSVSKKFAVESGDLITVIRRVGGVFSSAGGSVNELMALFTSVRATTRESAETIATGLRTIFTRIQRTDTVQQLEQLGIALRDSRGQFVGAYEAVRRLSVGLSALDPKDFRFSEIVESLGGFRQIGKVIPLIQQFTTAQDALNVAQAASGSVTRDAELAQQGLGVQAKKVREEFAALIRKFTDSSAFKSVASGALEMARAFIKIAEALEPLIPLIGSLIALKVGTALAPGLGALVGLGGKARGRAGGGRVHAFARGGFVPGSGNRDTVPAMLQPGEFVIKKSSAKKLGAERLAQMNGNRYASGGIAQFTSSFAKSNMYKGRKKLSKPSGEPFEAGVNQFTNFDTVEADITRKKISVADTIKKAHGTNKKRLLAAKQFNAQKTNPQIQGQMFEELLRDAGTLGGSKSKYGGPAPLDGTYGSRFGEVKRTSVSDNALLDKRLRHEQKHNQLRNQTLTSRGKDTIGLTGVTELSPNATSLPIAQFEDKKKKGARGRASGGLIQRFALGGIAKARKAGAAILDPNTAQPDSSINVSVAELNNKFPKFRGLRKGASPVADLYKATNFNVMREGLSQSTSDKFQGALNQGLVEGTNKATKTLAGDLGTSSAQLAGDSAKRFVSSVRPAIRGDLFEAALLSMNNDATFDSAVDPNRPFDFKGGLKGGLKDNFPTLPSAYVDAKSSYKAASDANMKQKIVGQLVQDLKGAGVENLPIRKRGAKKAHGGKIDSVPSLLTPGEFVINKSSAQSIGYGNLNKMNQTGVKRFAAGGAVQRFADGGGVNPIGANVAQVMSGLDPKTAAMLDRAMQDNAKQFNELAPQLKNLEPHQVEAALKAFSRGASKGAENLVDVAKTAADVVTELDRIDAMESSPMVTEEQRSDARRRRDEIGPGGGPPIPVPAVQSVQDRLGGAAAERKQAKAHIGISLKGRSGDEGADLDKAMKNYTNLISIGVDHQEALNETMKTLEITEKKSIKERIAGSSTVGGLKKAGRGIAKGVGGVGRAAEGASGAAAAAQSIAFMGGTAIATAVQMSGLSDATKQAVTETVGFASGLLAAGGTAIQMLSGLAQVGKVAAAAETLETTSNLGAAGTEEVESAANLKSAASEGAGRGMSGASKALVGVGLAAVAVSSVFKYFAASARASADQMKKSTDKLLADLEAGKGGDAGVIQAGVQGEIAARGEAAAFDSAAMAGGGAALAGGLAAAGAAAAMGAAMGSTVPIIGTVIGALVGVGVGLWMYNSANEEAAEAARKQAEAINGSIEGYVRTTQSLGTFNQALGDIDLEKNLKPEQRVSRRLAAGAALDTGAGNLPGEFEKLAALAQKAGKPIAALTEADFEGMPAELQAFKFASKATAKTLEALSAKTKAARQTLSEAADISFTGEFSFDEVMAANGDYAKSLRAAQQAIKQETNAQITAKQAEVKSMRDAANARYKEAGPTKAAHEQWVQAREAAAQEEAKIGQMRKRESQQQKDLLDGQKAVADAAKKQRDAELKAAAAAEALRRELNAMKNTMKAVRAIQSHQVDVERANKGVAARLSGGDFDVMPREIQGLSDIKVIDNVKKFNSEMNHLINEFPPAVQKNMRKQLKVVTDTNKLMTQGKDKVTAQFGTIAKGTKVDPDAIIKASGFDISGLPKTIQEEMRTAIIKATEGGKGIDAETFDKIFAPAIAMGEQAGQNLQELEKTRNKDITNYKSYLNNMETLRNKQLQDTKDVIKAESKGLELRAKARGGELSIGARQAARSRAAQVDLRGTGVRAGDAGGAARANLAAKARRKQIEADIRLGRDSRTGKKLDLMGEKQLRKEDKKLQNTIKKTTAELSRLADQSELAGDMMAEIDKERAKREVVTDIIGEFVVGGAEERKGLIDQFTGVMGALSTGTLQNQTADQRSATVGLLDRLSNVMIAGTGGLTGKQVKQEIIFQDAIRMGLDPAIADMLSSATSKEQQLINALDKLTREMVNAARLKKGVGEAFAQGGVVYRADGGSLFKPKGTDTVPAMLTPGEFVIRKSAVDKIGVGNLHALNRAQGGPVYLQQGGQPGAGMGRINVANARFAGGEALGEGVKIMTGEQYKFMFRQAMQSVGMPGVMKAAHDAGFKKEHIKDLKLLLSAGALRLDKIKGAQSTADRLDNMISNSEIFEKADAGNVVFKPSRNQMDDLAGATKGTPEGEARVKDWLEQNSKYAKTLAGVGRVPRGEGKSYKFHLAIMKKAGLGEMAGNVRRVQQTARTKSNEVYKLVGDVKTLWDSLKGPQKARAGGFGNYTGRWILTRPKWRPHKRWKEAGWDHLQAAQATRVVWGKNQLNSNSTPDNLIGLISDASFEKNYTGKNKYNTALKEQYYPVLKERTKLPDVAAKKAEHLVAAAANAPGHATLGRKAAVEAAVKGGGGARSARAGKAQAEAFQRLIDANIVRFASGGNVAGQQDTIPAMLTPGEFVMSKDAVQKHGVGYMKHLNRGRIPGFNRGGLIGHGNVAYRQNGSKNAEKGGGGMVLSLDASRVQAVLDTFNTTFSASLKTYNDAFGTLKEKLGELVSAFSGGLQMTHKFTGDISMNVSVGNHQQIADAVGAFIQSDLEEKITTLVAAGIKDIPNNPGT